MELSWIETYYTALEFIYWEPQHLGRKKNPDAALDSLEKVANRLRTLEVTLNHNLDQFFRLAPVALRKSLFSLVFARSFDESLELHGRQTDSDFNLISAMQPDFFFESPSEVISIEMKIRAKSSVAQILKYALLGLAVEQKRGAEREHYLLMLSRDSFSSLWQEKFTDLAALNAAVSTADLGSFLQRQPPHFRGHRAAFTRVASSLKVAWMTYSQLAAFLRAARPDDVDASPFAEVYRKLIDGLLAELSARGLVR